MAQVAVTGAAESLAGRVLPTSGTRLDIVTLDRVPAAPQHGDFVRVDLTTMGRR